MKPEIFAEILGQLNRGERAELKLTVDGHEYLRSFVPGDRLILLGGGHVSYDVYRMAFMLGFDITVVDDRPEFANNTRFPEATVICDSFESAVRNIRVNDSDFVCVLTRGHRWDAECVRTILSGEMPYYLGMIGSKRRVQGLKELLGEEGFPTERINMLHAPIGLPINASTTAEIALSICSEMIAEKRRVKEFRADNELTQTNVDYDMLRFIAESEEPRAVLIVISSAGSTPVKSGSMMAVNILGKGYGTIGGGCSEAAAVSRARKVIGSGESCVINIDMSNEVAAENGMVCGGEMTIYIEDIALK